MAATASGHNALSKGELKQGWQLLFDGKSHQGWHQYGQLPVGAAWTVKNGALTLATKARDDWQTKDGGDIVTDEIFDNFHLKLEWKISKGGNSGIFLFVDEDKAQHPYAWSTGLEMQILDNAAHPDAKIFKHRAGDLYDLIPAAKENTHPFNTWNAVEITCLDGQLEMYLNGEKLVATRLWDAQWAQLVAGSKFKAMPSFGSYRQGHIGLQDHGDEVSFRNIKIRRLNSALTPELSTPSTPSIPSSSTIIPLF